MLTEMRNRFQVALRQAFNSTMAALPALTAGEITKLSWAKSIESYAEVPAVYKGFFEPLLAEGRPVPYSILTPSFEGFLHRTTEKLICYFGNELYILEKGGNTFTVQCYPLQEIHYVEFGSILLDGWIKISGVGSLGTLNTSTCKFNSVTDYLVTPFLDKIRPGEAGSQRAAARSELEKFDQFVQVSFKYMNYAKRSLLPGERVIYTVLQPEIREEKLRLLGKAFHKKISPAQMCILTDRELIVIREDDRWSYKVTYGGIWDYIPLNKIVSLSQSEQGKNSLLFSIHLPNSARLDFVFRASMKREIDLLIGRYRQLAPTFQRSPNNPDPARRPTDGRISV